MHPCKYEAMSGLLLADCLAALCCRHSISQLESMQVVEVSELVWDGAEVVVGRQEG